MLFDNNYGFDINLMNLNNNKVNILSPYESLIKGNSFKDEYIPYKNYSYIKIQPTNNKEKLLFQIMSLCFIINDLNLYLDLNPNNKEILELFSKYITEEKELEQKYIKEYGPLTINDISSNSYNWLGNMPWENNRGDIYV